MTQEPLIQTNNLTKHYGAIVAVKDLNLQVNPGEIFGFLGPNGAGKTTTIRVLMGLIKPTAGTASVTDLDCWQNSVQIKSLVGYLPDFPSMYESLKGAEFLDYMADLNGTINQQRRQNHLNRLELSNSQLQQTISSYSRGMKQKLALVNALQKDPRLLILDEPTEGLDPLVRETFFSIIKEYAAGGGTVFMSSHVLSEVERLCSKVGIIKEGTMVAVETLESLRARRLRKLEVTLEKGDPNSLKLPQVVKMETNGSKIDLWIQGDINPVIRALAGLDIKDVVFEQPHLEDIFLDYYRHAKDENA